MKVVRQYGHKNGTFFYLSTDHNTILTIKMGVCGFTIRPRMVAHYYHDPIWPTYGLSRSEDGKNPVIKRLENGR